MKTSTPESPKSAEPRAILLMGPPGSFKTTFLLQFPNLFVVDCDKNLDGPETHLRQKGFGISYTYTQPSVKDDGTAIDPADCYQRILTILQEEVKPRPEFKWVGIDGLSSINEYIIRKIMHEQKISYMEARNWSTFKSDAIGLIYSKLRHLGRNIIVTAHETRIETNDKKNMMEKILIGYEPFIQSKVSEMLGGFFTDVWRISCKFAPGDKIEWTLQTMKIPFYDQLKNSLGLPPEMKNVTYKDLEPYLNGVKK